MQAANGRQQDGIHVWLAQPVRLAGLIARGLLIENGHWHERLKEGPVLRRDGIVSLWTGLLVKPSPGLWMLCTGSYNRRSQVNLKDTVVASSDGYTPLVLEFDLATMFKDTMWLEAELACLVPLQPEVSFERKTIRERPETGEAHNDFYGKKYLEARGEGKAVGRYRKLAVNPPPVSEHGPAVCELIHIAGPEVHMHRNVHECARSRGCSARGNCRLAVFRHAAGLHPALIRFRRDTGASEQRGRGHAPR